MAAEVLNAELSKRDLLPEMTAFGPDLYREFTIKPFLLSEACCEYVPGPGTNLVRFWNDLSFAVLGLKENLDGLYSVMSLLT